METHDNQAQLVDVCRYMWCQPTHQRAPSFLSFSLLVSIAICLHIRVVFIWDLPGPRQGHKFSSSHFENLPEELLVILSSACKEVGSEGKLHRRRTSGYCFSKCVFTWCCCLWIGLLYGPTFTITSYSDIQNYDD